MITPDSIPTPVPNVSSRIMDGEAVLVHPGKGEVKVLNEIGAEIWKRLDGGTPIREVIDILMGLYTVDREILEQDVLRFIEGLSERDLVSIAAPPDGS